jgi:hypothetical protein
MATAFRSSQSVTNGAAGTTVVVTKPAGLVDTGLNPSRDHLIAYIAAGGAPSITPPAGWTLVNTVASGTAVRLWMYHKLASSEPASWTWTLGTSLRTWGWVGAYTGVDPTTPITATGTDNTLTGSTALSPAFAAIASHGQGISAAAAVRAATGVATTWTPTSTERADLSTNAGAGIDITGDVADSVNPNDFDGSYAPTLTASQAQTDGVALSCTLNPYFTPYDGGLIGLSIEAALGADPDSDLSTATWTPITQYVNDTTGQVGGGTCVSIQVGRPNASGVADPADITFTLINLSGEFTHPAGAFTRYLVQKLPIRVRINGFGTHTSYHRGTAFLDSAKVRWDPSLNTSFVDVVALGRLSWIQRNSPPLHSAGYNYISNSPDFGALRPIAYWSFEDGSGAAAGSSAIAGVDPASVIGVTFGASNLYTGSDALATLSATSSIVATPPLIPSNQWLLPWACSLPTEPAAQTIIMKVFTTGTAYEWRVSVTPGTSALVLDVLDTAGASLLSTSVAIDEAHFYGKRTVFCLAAFDSGANIDYALSMNGDTGGGLGGTIAGRTKGVVYGIKVDPAPGLDNAIFGHLGFYNNGFFADALSSATVLLSQISAALVFGSAGELPSERFQRLCLQSDVPNTVTQSATTDLTMGKLGISTLGDLLRECADVEGCLMHDAGTNPTGTKTGVLEFPARDRRDNAAATMILDFASRQLADFQPILDGQNIVNDVEVTRPGGGSARATDEESIATRGRWPTQLTRNVNSDDVLIHLAQWAVNMGTVPGMRYPQVDINLRASPLLAQQWLASPLSSKILITSPPSQYQPDSMPAFLEGYREELGTFRWDATLNLSPAQPNSVFVLAETAADAGEFVGRLAPDQAVLRGDHTSTTTSIAVDPNFGRFTTVADDFVPNLRVRAGGESMDVSAVATTAATFVAVGAASHADNAAVSPAIYAGAATGDLIGVVAATRGAGTLATPAGYTRLTTWAAVDNVALFVKVHSGSESAPTITPSGGAAGDTVSAVTFGFRNMPTTLADLNGLVQAQFSQLNASAQNINYPRLMPLLDGSVILLLAWKQDDYTSVAPPAGFTEMIEASTVTGGDQSLYVAYQIQTAPAVIENGSLVVTGGAAAISRAATVVLPGGFQTMTVTRSVNGVVKAQANQTLIEVENDFVLGL